MFYLTILLSLYIKVFSLTTAPNSVCPNGIYSSSGIYFTYEGSYFIDTSLTYLAAGNVTDQLLFIVSLGVPQVNSNYLSAVTIQQISYKVNTVLMNFSLKLNNQTQTDFTISFASNQMRKISILNFRYLIISSALTYFTMDYITVEINKQIVYLQTVSKTIQNITTVSLVGGVKVFYSITSISKKSSSNGEIGIQTSVTRPTSTSFLFTISGTCSGYYKIYSISYVVITVNLAQANAGIIRSSIQVGSYIGGINTLKNILIADSIISGFYGFHYHIATQFSFKNIELNNTALWSNNKISASININYLGFRIFTNAFCCQSNLYYFANSNLCYDTCPIGTWTNLTALTCSVCNYDCQYCSSTNSSQCISCNALIHFRVFNGSTKRCDPLPGYFDSFNVTIAQPCSSNCIYCITAWPCLACNPSSNLTLGGICDLLPGIITNCASTNLSGNITICNYCNVGYILISNQCPQHCGDGLKLPAQICDDGNIMNGDGCSATCNIQVGYYCHSLNNSLNTSHCCQIRCQICSSPNFCLLCYNQSYMLPNMTKCGSNCPVSYFANDTIRVCQKCPYLCLQCQNFNQCQICENSLPVIAGCSNNSNCIQVYQSLTSNISWCIACSYNQILNANFQCVCKLNYWKVTNYCINVIGCIAAIWKTNVSVCINCNMINNFILANGMCNCVTGYALVVDRCQQVCGDGRLYDMECDDGNNYDGDGCSSYCTIEKGYRCFNGSINESSRCFYFHQKVQLKLLWANKTQGKNQGVFSFEISPNLIMKDIQKAIINIQFQCSPLSKIQKWSFQRNLLTVIVNYEQNLQNNQAYIKLQLNPVYFKQSTLNLNFTMKSIGVLLIIYDQYDIMAILRIGIFVIGLIVLALFVIGSLTHKLMGVQLINTVNLLLFCFNCSGLYTQPFMLFKQLTLVNLNFKYLNNQMNNLNSNNLAVQFNPDNTLISKSIILLAMCLFILGFSIQPVYTNYVIWRNKQNKEQSKKYQLLLTNLQKILYNKFIFPFSIGFIYLNIFIQIQSNHIHINLYLSIFLQLSLFIITAFSYFCQWKTILIKANKFPEHFSGVKNCKYTYVWSYLTYIYCTTIILYMKNKDWFKAGVFGFSLKNSVLAWVVILILTIIIFVWFIRYRPYKNRIHNFGQIINLSLVIGFIVLCCVREQNPDLFYQSKQIQFVLGFIVMLGVVIVVHISRIIFQIKRKIKNSQKIKKKVTKELFSNMKEPNINIYDDVMQNLNPYSIFTQKLKSQIKSYNSANKERLLVEKQPLFNFTKPIDNIQILKAVSLVKVSKQKKESSQLAEIKDKIKKRKIENTLLHRIQ